MMNQDLADVTCHFSNWVNMSKDYFKWLNGLLSEPDTFSRLQALQMAWYEDIVKLLNQTDEIAPQKDDRRFKHPAWREQPYFRFIQQWYLLSVKHIHQFMMAHSTGDVRLDKKLQFFTQQCLDALAPTNFVMTNPEVLNEIINSGGANLVRGLKSFLEDVARGQGTFTIKMTDLGAFKPGKNIAITPGEVVYENNIMQLIRYAPTTEEVHERPVLIIPPWINKYYILDLRPDNSLVKWLVDKGHTIYMISWVNPDETYRGKAFEDYLFEGPLQALKIIDTFHPDMPVNLVGYCLGGTLLSILLGLIKDKRQISSATFFTTLIDFSDTGDVEAFIDEAQIKMIELRMKEKGYLDGRMVANTFAMLRANDLLWNYFIQNYLLGKDPFPFDLLYWNADSTNLPENMHSFYLRNMYLENKLIKGTLSIAGEKIDLSQVDTPAYFISTELDHIAPWQTTYQGALAFRGPTTFVLGGAGHIAGVVNPPVLNKYDYRIISGALPGTAQEWYKQSERFTGSWWVHWEEWLKGFSKQKIASIRLDAHIESAPGRYVLQSVG